ncbi:MAG: AMP-binding protein, partial [Cyanobacteria bacterium CRU_2_1]|nr:AMP-binding protein [Cyanobacteria bacterium CRU_2_1]
MTYQVLDERANQLAHLLRSQGVAPEVRVGIYVERSLDLLVAVLGVLKAGGAYVPLDPTYPQERLSFMLSDAQATVILTHRHLLAGLPCHQSQVVVLDQDWEAIAQAFTPAPADPPTQA